MTRIYSEYIIRRLDNGRFVQLANLFGFFSDELAKAGFSGEAEIQADFIMDEESIPLIKGRNARGGAVHDYFSCYDSIPVVSKSVAAAIYFEINEYTDSIDCGRDKLTMLKDWTRRWSKWAVVYVWPGYFHKRSIHATCEELYGFKGDPYITIEKLKTLIIKSEKVTEEIKEVKSEQTPILVEKSVQVTDALKDAKEVEEAKS